VKTGKTVDRGYHDIKKTRHAISFKVQKKSKKNMGKVPHAPGELLVVAEPAAETNGEKKPATKANPEAKAKAEPKPSTSPVL